MKRAINKVLLIGNLGRDPHCVGMFERIERAFTFEPSKSGKGAMNWASISDGAPESGGGGASAAQTVECGSPEATSDDDDGGDPDPEPARRRPKKSAIAHDSGETLLRLRGVQARVPLSKSAIYKLISEKKFPEPIRLSARCSLWRASDVDAFVSSLT
ncbi:MAG: AlpA family phage regulatory protein [Burkholderiales bacterium]|nr:AlpA family phage regulatory protein [Burkholderiales bacterium]